MLKILAIGMMLWTMFSCNAPNVEDPVYSCVINTKEMIARCGDRNLNYRLERNIVGEWVDRPVNFDISEADNMVCFGLNDWLEEIKPTLKETHDFWVDSRD